MCLQTYHKSWLKTRVPQKGSLQSLAMATLIYQHHKASVRQLPSRTMQLSAKWRRWLRWCWAFMRLWTVHSSMYRTTILKMTLTESQPSILRCVHHLTMVYHLRSLEGMGLMHQLRCARVRNLVGIVTIQKTYAVKYSTKKEILFTCQSLVSFHSLEINRKISSHVSCKTAATRRTPKTKSSIIHLHSKHSHALTKQKNSFHVITRIVLTFTMKQKKETSRSLQIQQRNKTNRMKNLRLKLIADKSKRPPILLEAAKAILKLWSKSKRNLLINSIS